MLVHRSHDSEPVDPAALARGLLTEARERARSGPSCHDDVADLLVRCGELEAALADALEPEVDAFAAPALPRAREASMALGHALVASWRAHGPEMGAAMARAARALGALAAAPLPTRAQRGTPEGYAWYALYPETYLEAAERALAAHPARRVLCVGIRGIGTSLSAVVAAVAEGAGREVRSLTVRPRGHPFERRLVLAPSLRRIVHEWRDALALVVDEGPGLSGSSFAAVAESLVEIGVPPACVVLLPSWAPDGSAFRSERARRVWRRHEKVVVSFEELWLRSGRLAHRFGARELRDVSGGAWRHLVYDHPRRWPAVQPRHERRKYVSSDADGGADAVLWRFVGLGRHGCAARERAGRLAAAGFCAAPGRLEAGFLGTRWMPVRPLAVGEAGGALVDRQADYVAHLRREHATGEAVPVDRLREMARVNAAEALGDAWAGRAEAIVAGAARMWRDVPAVAVDGRMLPHEWIRGDDGRWMKTDALDHHRDHFLPGAQDAAWDLAGAIEELPLGAELAERLVARYARLTGDAGVSLRLPAARAAYLAYRVGYATMAAETLAAQGAEMCDDASRFTRLARRYRVALRERLSEPRLVPATASRGRCR
ncbi:MAG TPA: hypothetical protein VFY16_08580 [Gemmatimonadaceae bacterium]|nr:hypothetical protein [Gemmatimonadaceae bacterium]